MWPFEKPQVTIGPMRSDHAAFAAKLHSASFAHGWSEDEIRRMLSNSGCVGCVAVEPKSRKPLGFVLAQCAADEAEILTIAVAANARKLGIGQSLLRHEIPTLVAKGVRSLFLEVDRNNQVALKLYNKFGFTEVGQRPGYYRLADGTTATALILRATIG